MAGDDAERGLDASGHIRREGSLDRVGLAFGPVAADLRGCVATRFGSRLHSGYLYGSIPRGTAVDPAERYDLGFFLACLCTPLLGEDVGRMLPSYQPTLRLARGHGRRSQAGGGPEQ